VAAQAIEGRKCAETAKVHPDLRIVYNLAYGVLAGEAGRFSLVGDYTTKNRKARGQTRAFFLVWNPRATRGSGPPCCGWPAAETAATGRFLGQSNLFSPFALRLCPSTKPTGDQYN